VPRVRSHRAAAAALAARDPVMASLVGAAGWPAIRKPQRTHFEALVRSILFQQLAGAAAATIHARFVALCEDDVTPERVVALPFEAMRGAGLSGNKAASVTDLATKVLDGTVVLDPRGIARLSDEQIIERLTTVRGIGRWTTEMFLLFQLRRLDVWPVDDLGVRKGYGLAYGVPMPSSKELGPLGDVFAPYRSVAAWYLWRAVDIAVLPLG